MAGVDQRSSSFLFVLLAFIVPVIINVYNASTGPSNIEKLDVYMQNELIITIPIVLRYGDEGFNFPDLARAAQLQVDKELGDAYSKLKVELIDELEISKTTNNHTEGEDQYTVELIHADEDFVGIDSELSKCYVFYTLNAIHANDLPFYIAQGIVHHLLVAEIWTFKFSKLPQKMVLSDSAYQISITSDCFTSDVEDDLIEYFKNYDDLWNVDFTLHSDINANEITDFRIIVSNSTLNSKLDENEVFVKVDRNDTLSAIKREIENHLGLSEHPSNNLKIKLQSIYRVYAIRILEMSIQKLVALKKSNSANVEELIQAVFALAEQFETVKTASWIPFFVKSKEIWHQIKSLDIESPKS